MKFFLVIEMVKRSADEVAEFHSKRSVNYLTAKFIFITLNEVTIFNPVKTPANPNSYKYQLPLGNALIIVW